MRGDRDLEQRAARAGLLTEWVDAFGKPHRVSPETLRTLLDTLGAEESRPLSHDGVVTADASRPILSIDVAPKSSKKTARIELEYGGVRDCGFESMTADRIRLKTSLPSGYHRVEIGNTSFILAAAPARCFTVSDAIGAGDNLCGIATQLYSLRRDGDLGFGDFSALTQFVAAAAKHGAAAVALSPVHAMFGADASRFSPYSPSNRQFLNVLYAGADEIDEGTFQSIIRSAKLQHELDDARRRPLIDWPKSAATHRILFERIFDDFASGNMPGASDFSEFRQRGGQALQDHAIFEALDEESIALKPAASSRQTRQFADVHATRVVFHQFMQWCAARGLSAAQSAARTYRMPIGLIADLAVGVDPSGSECWSQPHDMLIGAEIGAPPDELNAIGQGWGLTTFSPHALRREGFSPFLRVVRAAMRHSGGIRLDHVMSLMRLWLVPNGAQPIDGAYLRYPFEDLIRLVALESWRHRCIVIGEDLGTVPDDCRAQLARAGILGLDVLPFMRDGRAFVPPLRWRANAVAMTSTHDVATVAGWWAQRDLDWRKRLRLFGNRSEATERAEREKTKAQLARAFARPGTTRIGAHATPDRVEDAAIDFIARSASPLAMVPVEDLVAAIEQPNLPGTIAEHPNWRRRYRSSATKLLDEPRVAARMRRLAKNRKPNT